MTASDISTDMSISGSFTDACQRQRFSYGDLMRTRLVKQVSTGLLCLFYVFILIGCGSLYSRDTDVRNLTDNVGANISIGDQRQKVRAVLGEPLIDARSLGVEVYRNIGRDFAVAWVIAPWVPIPLIGGKVIAVVLIIYDEHDLVKNISTGIVEHDSRIPDYSLWLAADDYVFTNTARILPPDMLLGPAVSWEHVQVQSPTDGRCELVLVMRHYCPMEQVFLDNEKIADLSSTAVYCGFTTDQKRASFAAIIRKDIPTGHHNLKIHQTSWPGDFDASFECTSGERVFAEYQAYIVLEKSYFEGEITVSKNIPSNVFEVDEIRQILWYGGSWYGSVDNSIENKNQ